MHEFRAELDGEAGFVRMKREDAAADAVACFEQQDMPAGRGKLTGSREASHARADDEHVGEILQRRFLGPQRFARLDAEGEMMETNRQALRSLALWGTPHPDPQPGRGILHRLPGTFMAGSGRRLRRPVAVLRLQRGRSRRRRCG
jgi:hypothetical protein